MMASCRAAGLSQWRGGACHDSHGHGGQNKWKGRERELTKVHDQWVQGCIGMCAWVQRWVELDPQSMHGILSCRTFICLIDLVLARCSIEFKY